MASLRMAQYGTRHGHADGKLMAMLGNPDVEFVGVYEPDAARRAELECIPGPFQHVRWFDSKEELLDDSTIVAVASEGCNDESLAQTAEIVAAGKHVWYDKPAGDDWNLWREVVELARRQRVIIQMGYMFRYHHGFRQMAAWVKSGLLGEVFAIRAHMSRWIPESDRQIISRHAGGIFYDLAGHMIDQIVWLLGRPHRVTSFLRRDASQTPNFKDNTLSVFEFERAMAYVDIAAMEPPPEARRFEIYGTVGSVIMEPFEPAQQLRLCLRSAQAEWREGVQFVPVQRQSRQELYDQELVSFLAAVRGMRPPDRSLDHELLVQETLLRATGGVS